jgi:simple sugar transport system permease protein
MTESKKPENNPSAGGPPEAGFQDRLADFSRQASLSLGVLFIPVISLLVLVVLIFILSDTPARTLFFFFIGPFRNLFSFGNMVNSSLPLIFGALGVTVAMKGGHLNLGGEGQVYLGAFTTTAAALAFSGSGIARFGVIGIILAAAAGVLASGAAAAFCGFCKAKWNTNELITTFLLSNALIPVVNYLVTGPFLDPETSLLSTGKIDENMRLALILKPSSLSSSLYIALVFVLITHLFLARTKKGYEIRMAGNNEIFARYGGVNTKFNTVLAMAMSGGLYGLAGSLAVLGTYHATIKEFSAGLGWNGLAVALIAGFYPPAVIPAALFFAWLGAGARIAMQNTGLTLEVASIVQSLIFFLSTSLLIRNLFARKGRV